MQMHIRKARLGLLCTILATLSLHVGAACAAQPQKAPPAPKISSVVAVGHSVTIEWTHARVDDTADASYRVYYTESADGELKLLDQVVGSNTLSTDELPASARLYFYVSAVDSTGAESPPSKPKKIVTGEKAPTMRDDVELTDLEEIGAIYKKPNENTLIITSQAKPHKFSESEIIISYLEESSFVAEILSVSYAKDTVVLELKPRYIFEFLSGGGFSIQADIDAAQ